MEKERIIFLVVSLLFLGLIVWVVLNRKNKENFGRPDIGVPTSDFMEGPGEGRLWPPGSKQIHVTSICPGCG